MIYHFEEYELDTAQLELRRNDAVINLEPLTFSLLVYLIENHDRVTTKDDINTHVWGGRIVSEAALSSAVHAARAAIGDSGQAQRLIKTVHGKGFRFVGKVKSAHTDPETPDTPETSSHNKDTVPSRYSIAVLPFDNMSGDPEQDYFADGMCEDIITVLAKISGLVVSARNASFAYKGQSINTAKVGQDLGVRYLLEGSVRRSHETVRITAQLIEAASGAHVWAERYDRKLADIFKLQDEMTREIVSALQINMTLGDTAKLFIGGTQNYKAWENLIRARFLLLQYERSKNLIAKDLLQDAIRLDPDYLAALNLLGVFHYLQVFSGWSSDLKVSLASAKDYAERALAIEPDNPESLRLVALVNISSGHYAEARTFADKALAIAPDYHSVIITSAFVDYYTDNLEAAAAAVERAMRFYPNYNIQFPVLLAWIYFGMKRYDEAYEKAKETLQINPNYFMGSLVLAAICARTDRLEEAEQAIKTACEIYPGLNLDIISKVLPIKNPESLDHILQALRKAGLPK